jgi:uncharacterized protein YjaG (DUF416 family)
VSSRSQRLFFVRIAEIRRRLERLEAVAQVAFAAACSERLLPVYVSFSLEARWGRPEFLRGALNAVWEGIDSGKFDGVPCAPTENDHEEDDGISPSVFAPEAAGVDSAPGALSACAAVYATLDAAHGRRPCLVCAVEASQQALETMDWLIYEHQLLPDLHIGDGGRSDRRVDEHPLMVREYQRQLADLDLFESAPVAGVANVLRRRWTAVDITADQGPAA